MISFQKPVLGDVSPTFATLLTVPKKVDYFWSGGKVKPFGLGDDIKHFYITMPKYILDVNVYSFKQCGSRMLIVILAQDVLGQKVLTAEEVIKPNTKAVKA